MANETSDLELLCGENFEVGIEGHQQIIVRILVEDSRKRLLVH